MFVRGLRRTQRTQRIRRGGRALLTGLAATAVLAGAAGAAQAAGSASAAGSTPTTAPATAPAAAPAAAPTGDGAQALCKRVPKIDRRIERALARLDGGSATRGSVARLQLRVDNAKKAGHDEIATYLQHRLDFRKKLPAMLEQRQKDLTEVRTWCQDNGYTVGKK